MTSSIKKPYIAPQLTVVPVCAERGYSESSAEPHLDPVQLSIVNDAPETELREVSTGWDLDNDENFWNQLYDGSSPTP